MTKRHAPIIEIPHDALVVLIGPAASGKSTFAAKRFLETQVVSSDRCRALLCDDPGNQAVSGRAFELFHFLIGHRLAIRRLTVADSTALEARARRDLLALAQASHRPVVAIIFHVSRHTCLKRDALRERKVGAEVIDRHMARLRATYGHIGGEAFDRIYLLDEPMAAKVHVRLVAVLGPPAPESAANKASAGGRRRPAGGSALPHSAHPSH